MDLVSTGPQGLKINNPDWMPDPAVYNFVVEVLKEEFNIDAFKLGETWLPLSIIGTLDWVKMFANWWLVEYSGIRHMHDEPYETLYEHDYNELLPETLMILRRLKEAAGEELSERITRPGLDTRERRSVVPFVRNEVFQGFSETPPPNELLEKIIWATFIWLLCGVPEKGDKMSQGDHGYKWMREHFYVFDCCHNHVKAFLSEWENGEPLPPELTRATNRDVGTCLACGHALHCVDIFALGRNSAYLCYKCANDENEKGNIHYFGLSVSEANPLCMFNPDGPNPRCMKCSCPHVIDGKEKLRDMWAARTDGAIEDYRSRIRQVGGGPRQLAGQSLEDIVSHFNE